MTVQSIASLEAATMFVPDGAAVFGADQNERSFNDHRTEIDKLSTEKFGLNEQKHADLQENFREPF